MTEMRLQRALARAGIASRRAAEELIRAGRVKVNGTVAVIGMKVNAETDVITVGRRRVTQARKAWIALHKPVGYVVTKRDPQRRQTIFELIPEVPGLTYVGRLDVMTSGLLLLTNDGEAAHRLMHPRFEVERSYRVVVHGKTDDQIHAAFAKPIIIEGRAVNVKTIKTRPDRANSIEMLLVLAEGRYRIVRRICEKLGLAVERLVRLSYGPIRLGDLAPGTWRYLTRSELAALAGMPSESAVSSGTKKAVGRIGG